ncbi:protein kinase domain-containing protein [Mycobacterium antarcticum]|uniref:protein kinase domain-containing protein n=1 Tax=Mycolicibacterium sp. TUM20983 TaxID=3023369 RepID=UPI0024E101EF|nr:hypothetical protein [Mycolicibacterium sp. TUM20983]
MPLAFTLVEGAAAALNHTWRRRQITHRDVKPANTLIAFDTGVEPEVEAVKLAGFGIAKAVGESTSLTSTGITVGTVSYLSPGHRRSRHRQPRRYLLARLHSIRTRDRYTAILRQLTRTRS